jgi:hypothetical protein
MLIIIMIQFLKVAEEETQMVSVVIPGRAAGTMFFGVAARGSTVMMATM